MWVRARALGAPTPPIAPRFGAPSPPTRVVGRCAALLWICTGLWRLLAGTEKPTGYYLANHVFWIKMVLLGGDPGARDLAHGDPDPLAGGRSARGRSARSVASAPALARISYAQAVLVVLMVLAATAMAAAAGLS